MSSDQTADRPAAGNVVQLDDAILAACGPALRSQLLIEAAMLVEAFAPEATAAELEAMAATLAMGARDSHMDAVRARRLASALRCLARGFAA